MKFYFPDSQDQIDPSFNFITEERSIYRVRQRDDHYAHEALCSAPFDGILVSKAIVDGLPGATGKYTVAQRQRFYRAGVQKFFRLDRTDGTPIDTLGDCGAFTYVRDDVPPYTVDEVIDFYDGAGFNLGISIDHVVLGYDINADQDPAHPLRREWQRRQDLTIELAAEFRSRARTRKVHFQPIGVAHGWSPSSYASAVQALQRIGYTRIALGGMVPLKTRDILTCLQAVRAVRRPRTQLHLLGITRCENVEAFAAAGVTSFDSTSPFRQSFKDDTDNYYALNRTYTALRVPQVDANPKLKARIRAGQVPQAEAIRLEQHCLTSLRGYAQGTTSIDTVLQALGEYDQLCDGRKDRTAAYRDTLENQPWKTCACGLCRELSIEIAVFRGAERNKRRGFHNLHVFRQRLDRELEGTAA
ncbi:tRNA-guanine transglycosylase DpdA [uncultured Jatrophihabitans sp.]|uniref:tRNA-guanine transglycosylase DpdA n=1 Tax=uncultured Jatrophihabitans sp. TaxID=1610747 RepID=UPI0035CA32AB